MDHCHKCGEPSTHDIISSHHDGALIGSLCGKCFEKAWADFELVRARYLRLIKAGVDYQRAGAIVLGDERPLKIVS